MATQTAWEAFVEMGVLTALSNEFSGFDGKTNNALDIALGAAALHAHNTFRWSIQQRRAAAEPAAAAIKLAAEGVKDGAAGDRKTFYNLVEASATRPIFDGNTVQIENKKFATSKTEVVQALWELSHPAHAYVSEVNAARLERSDPTGVYTYLVTLLNEKSIADQAIKLEKLVSVLHCHQKRKRAD